MSNDVMVSVEGASKKFCRRLRRSLWYGVQDLGSELLGRRNEHAKLRQDEFWALRDVSFELRRGESLGVIGPNGAGKTTLLRMLNGLIKPDEGIITLRGRVGALVALGAGMNPVLTGRENIYINAAVLGIPKAEIDQRLGEIISFADIGDFLDTPVQFYSSGMRVRLGFSVAAHMEPDILLVDEVLSVGDASFRAKSAIRMRKLMGSGVTVVFVSHNMHLVSSICDRVILLDRGICQYVGAIDQGIQLYERTFLDKLLLERHSVELAIHGPVNIRSIELLDDSGRRVTEVGTDEPLTIHVVLESTHRVESPVFGIRMWRLDGTTYWNEKTLYHAVQTGVIEAEYEFFCRLQKIQATTGYYYFTINVFDGQTGIQLAKDVSDRFFVQSSVPLRDEQTDIYHPLLEWQMNL